MPDTLYVTDTSPFATRLRLVAAFTGQSLAEAAPPGGAGSDAMKAISHFGKMPAIVRDDRVLIESVPLMEYLVEIAGGSPLVPALPPERAAMRGIMLAHDHHVLGAIRPMFVELRSGKPDTANAAAAIRAGGEHYAVLTRLFDVDGGFALGGRMTLADLAIAPFALLFGRTNAMFGEPSPFAAQPRLAAWWESVSAVPEVASTLSVMDAGLARAFGR